MKLLLIMPNFFNYPQVIKEELNNMGYEVDFFDDRPSTNAWIKAIIRINKNLIYSYIQKYFLSIMKTIKNKQYDVVLLISGQSLSFTEEMIEQIKNCQKQAYFVLYQWDSQTNFPYISKMQKYFDKCYSFDKHDVDANPKLNFLPLFYSKQYAEIKKKDKKEFKYDFCFVGTAHPKKYKLIKMMSSQLEKVYPKQFIYYYFPSKIVFFYHKILDKEFRKADFREFHYIPLDRNKINDVYEKSRCVLDSPQKGQIGLTIRVLEALGAGKKVITTNQDVINYDFYCPENIYIYKGKIDLDNIFFTMPYVDLDKDIYIKYSLTSWLKTIINGGKNEYT